MAYRDDRDVLQDRVQELESELDEARDTIARLQGRTGGQVDDTVDRVLGAPLGMRLTRRLDVELDDEAYEPVAELLRARFPRGQTAQLGKSLVHRWGPHEIRVARRGKRTEIVATADHRPNRQGLLFGTPGLALIASLMVSGLLLDLGQRGLLLAAIPLTIVACFLGLRALNLRAVMRERGSMAATVEAAVELVERHARPRRIETTRGKAQKRARRIDQALVDERNAEALEEESLEEGGAAEVELRS